MKLQATDPLPESRGENIWILPNSDRAEYTLRHILAPPRPSFIVETTAVG